MYSFRVKLSESNRKAMIDMSNTRMTTTDGITFVTKSHDFYVSKSLEVYGEWSQGEINLLSHFIKTGDHIVEAGANIGAHTVFLANLVGPQGKVHAFEPRRVLFQTLCANLAVNGIEHVNARQYGLGDSASMQSEARMDFDAALNAGGTAIGDIPGDAETIEIVTLDSVLDARPISLIKADVEGHELQVLQGAADIIARDRPVIYLENDKPDLSPALITHLLGLGYDAWWHAVPLFNPDNRAKTLHNIFGETISLNMICLPRGMEVPDYFGAKIADAEVHPLAQT